MRPRDMTKDTWRSELSAFVSKHELVAIIGWATGKTGLSIAVGEFHGELLLPNTIFAEIVDWLGSLSREEFSAEPRKGFGRFVGKEQMWEVGCCCSMVNERGKTVKVPAQITLHANGQNSSFWVFPMSDVKQIIKWYNSEIKDEVIA